MAQVSLEERSIIDEGRSTAKQFLSGSLTKVSIDIVILQKILDDEFLKDLFIRGFNHEIEESKKAVKEAK